MIINWNNLPQVAGMREGSTRKGICGNKISAVRVTTAGNTEFDGKTHWHENEQLLVMLEGSVTVIIDGETYTATAGDMVFFPARSQHAAIATGPEGCTYYEIFSPARPDQLPGWVGESVLRYE